MSIISDKMLVAVTYRPCNGFKDGEMDMVLKYFDNNKSAYVFEGEAETQHLHGLVVKTRDRNSVTNVGLALRNIAKKFEGNLPKVTVKVKTAYKGAYKEEVGSNYGNYLEYMCKGLTTKLVSTLPDNWEEYLADDIAPEDRRQHDADEKIGKCIDLLMANKSEDDPEDILKSVGGVAYKIHDLVILRKWKHGRNFNENDYFATLVHSVINKIDYFDTKDNYKRLQRCALQSKDCGDKRKQDILNYFDGELAETHEPWHEVQERLKPWTKAQEKEWDKLTANIS